MASKSLRSASQLEYNVPGCIVSIVVPSGEIAKLHSEKLMVEINCKNFFTKLVKKTEFMSKSDTCGPAHTEIVSTLPPEAKLTKIANRYDNIIDQLERKYYCESMVQSKERDSDDDSDSSESEHLDIGESVGAAALPLAGQSAKGKKRKKGFADDYDVDDPFIDDEEMICEVEAAMKTNRTKTKHDGFFVSSGKLEVMSPKKMQKVSAVTNRPPKEVTAKPATTGTENKDTSLGEAIEENNGNGGEGEKGDNVKKRKRRTKKEIEEAIARGEFKPKVRQAPAEGTTQAATATATAVGDTAIATETTVEMATSTASSSAVIHANTIGGASSDNLNLAVSNDAEGKQQRPPDVSSPVAASAAPAKPKVEKAEWQPNEVVIAAMLDFQAHYEKSGVKLCKSSHIPKSLEESLREVDSKVITQINPEVLARTSGYYEGLQGIMGGEVNLGKIRSLLMRLRLRDRAEATRLVIEGQVTTLMAELKANVAPCPEKLQPAVKAAKKAQLQQQLASAQQATQAQSLSQSQSGGGVSASPAKAAQEDEEPATPAAAAAAEGEASAAMDVNGGSGSGAEAAATLLFQLGANSTAEAEVDAKEGAASTLTSASATSGAPVPVPVPVPVRYDWVCNWDRPMKVTLCQIEHNLKVWVVQENLYREKLTVHDKKHLSENEVSNLCV